MAAPVRTTDHTLIYDGDCAFCRASTRWVKRIDRRQRIQLVPIAEFDFSQHPQLTQQRCMAAMQLIGPDGGVRSGAAALRRVLRMHPLTWIVGAVFEIWPLTRLSAWGYGLIARNRHCLLPAARQDSAAVRNK